MMGRFDREWVDELKAKNRLLEAEVRKALGDISRLERELDAAKGELRARKAVEEARFSWQR